MQLLTSVNGWQNRHTSYPLPIDAMQFRSAMECAIKQTYRNENNRTQDRVDCCQYRHQVSFQLVTPPPRHRPWKPCQMKQTLCRRQSLNFFVDTQESTVFPSNLPRDSAASGNVLYRLRRLRSIRSDSEASMHLLHRWWTPRPAWLLIVLALHALGFKVVVNGTELFQLQITKRRIDFIQIFVSKSKFSSIKLQLTT